MAFTKTSKARPRAPRVALEMSDNVSTLNEAAHEKRNFRLANLVVTVVCISVKHPN